MGQLAFFLYYFFISMPKFRKVPRSRRRRKNFEQYSVCHKSVVRSQNLRDRRIILEQQHDDDDFDSHESEEELNVEEDIAKDNNSSIHELSNIANDSDGDIQSDDIDAPGNEIPPENDHQVVFENVAEELIENHEQVYNHSDSKESEAECARPQDNVKIMEKSLAYVFKTTNMNHVQCGAVLKALRAHNCFKKIHVDPRSILRTPKTTAVKTVGEGDKEGRYLHLGFKNALVKILQNTDPSMIPDVLEVDYHTDEASLDKACNIIMWPVQIRVANIPFSNPQVVGVYQGSSKPDDPSFVLTPFVDEVLETLGEGGVEYLGVKIPINLRAFIADAPARAFALCHNNHKSTAPCSGCYVTGKSLGRGVMVYKGVGHDLRNDVDYRARTDGEHHNETSSPLFRLPVDLVNSTVFDSMHLVYLGIMEKLMQAWHDGKFSNEVKLTPQKIKLLISRLKQVKNFCPSDFARKPWKLWKHHSFKATEHRQILLYTGPAIFNGIVNPAAYTHFLLLHTFMRLLTKPHPEALDIDIAETCTKIFVSRAEEIYGSTFLSYNMHAVLHLARDARLFGSLESVSAFPYENNMTFFRKMCRKKDKHLEQIARRYAEKSDLFAIEQINKSIKLMQKCYLGPVPPELVTEAYTRYSALSTFNEKIYLSIYQQNNTIFLHDSSICIIQTILKLRTGELHFVVKKFEKKVDFYDTVCFSSSVGVFHCSLLSPELFVISLQDIESKGFRMPYWPELETAECSASEYVVAKISSTTTWFANLN